MITKRDIKLAESAVDKREHKSAGERLYLFRQPDPFVADDQRREAEEDTIELERAEGRY